jgi:hypothetical protein
VRYNSRSLGRLSHETHPRSHEVQSRRRAPRETKLMLTPGKTRLNLFTTSLGQGNPVGFGRIPRPTAGLSGQGERICYKEVTLLALYTWIASDKSPVAARNFGCIDYSVVPYRTALSRSSSRPVRSSEPEVHAILLPLRIILYP